MTTGERYASKGARTVREGADGKGPEPRAPRRRPTSLGRGSSGRVQLRWHLARRPTSFVGDYKNGGREYQPAGEPVKVNTYDFIGEGGKAIPYGVYDVAANSGWVNVGTDADTGVFAVESIRRWWNRIGACVYPGATRLLISLTSGGRSI